MKDAPEDGSWILPLKQKIKPPNLLGGLKHF